MGVRGDFFERCEGKPYLAGNRGCACKNGTNAVQISNCILPSNGVLACGIDCLFFGERRAATLYNARHRKKPVVGTNARPLDSAFEYFDQQLRRVLVALRTGVNGVSIRCFATRFAKRMATVAVRVACIRAHARRATIAWIHGAAQSFSRRIFLWFLRFFAVLLSR